MHSGFGDRDFPKDSGCQVALLWRQCAFRKNRFHIGEEAIILLVRGLDRGFRRRESAALHLFHFQLDRQVERIEYGANRLRWNTRINHRTQDHVAANAAEAIEMSHTHRSSPPIVKVGGTLPVPWFSERHTECAPTLVFYWPKGILRGIN